METSLRGRDLLTLSDLTPDEVRRILELAKTQKRQWTAGNRSTPLAGRSVAMIFEKPSLRTMVSFEVACARLGAHPVVLAGPDTAFSRGESVYDTAKVLSRYVDAIVIRTFEQSLLEELADYADVPVVNALTDEFHPCQGLADLLTIDERLGRLSGVALAYVGDGNNMAHTYLLGGALTGMHVTIVSPEGYGPSPLVVARARAIADQTGARITTTDDPETGVAEADVVATDTWASMGREDEHAERVSAFARFKVDSGLMEQAKETAVFMHCLPAHRGEEVDDAVIDSECSIVFDEAENRLHAQKALLALLLG